MKKSMIAITAVTIIGISAYAFASGPGWGTDCGRGQGRMMGRGDGYHMTEPGEHMGRGHGRFRGNLTDEQIEQVETLRAEFFNATEELRGDIRQKRLALAAELAKKTPDEAAAMALQKELSGLRAEMDARRLTHRIEMKKIVPDAEGFYCPRFGSAPDEGDTQAN